MAKRPKSEEPDFLVRAKLPHDPFSFESVFREAYLLEHQIRQLQEIADVVGLTTGRMSQVFKRPEALKPETLKNLIAPIQSAELRRRILVAWNRECFTIDLESRKTSPITGSTVTLKTLRRVDRLIRESRIAAAAQLALEAANRVKDHTLEQEFLMRATWSFQRINRPGTAMQCASRFYDVAQSRGDRSGAVYAQLIRLRILTGLIDLDHSAISSIIDWLESASTGEHFDGSQAAPGSGLIMRSIIGARLTIMERDPGRMETAWLATTRQALLRDGSREGYQGRFASLFLASRASLLLGERFLARELLDQAFNAGGLKTIQVLEQCGFLESRIFASAGDHQGARDHLRAVSENCLLTEDFYHAYQAESLLANLEAGWWDG